MNEIVWRLFCNLTFFAAVYPAAFNKGPERFYCASNSCPSVSSTVLALSTVLGKKRVYKLPL